MSDLIDRQEAIDIVMSVGKAIPTFAIRAKDALNKLPTAEPKKGKWLKAYGEHEAFGVRPFYRYCSECNESTVWAYNFCPHCGTRMED